MSLFGLNTLSISKMLNAAHTNFICLSKLIFQLIIFFFVLYLTHSEILVASKKFLCYFLSKEKGCCSFHLKYPFSCHLLPTPFTWIGIIQPSDFSQYYIGEKTSLISQSMLDMPPMCSSNLLQYLFTCHFFPPASKLF